jgi:hypothetical protein
MVGQDEREVRQMVKGKPVARGQGWTDEQWRAFEQSNYDESEPAFSNKILRGRPKSGKHRK